MKNFLPLLLLSATAASAHVLVGDGSFELGANGHMWLPASTNFGQPFCYVGVHCGTVPRTGVQWIVLGDAGVYAEAASVQQTAEILIGEKILEFYVWWSSSVVNPPDPAAVFNVKVDGHLLFTLTPATAAAYSSAYTRIAIDVSDYANGINHTLRFEWYNAAASAPSILNLDDVRIVDNGIFAHGFQ
ncbi:MAG: hypothetical protein ABI411_07530 [Tahibacter sp.]